MTTSEARGKIVVAATGGVAALKTPAVVRRLAEAGYAVRVAATDAAYHFITKLSLAIAAGGEVFDSVSWFRPDGEARHIAWARWADLLLVAPASADALASAATGRADDVVSALTLSGVPQVMWAPAMNTAMWRHPTVVRNVALLRADGHRFVGPDEGRLAAKDEGVGIGRMSEPPAIVAAVDEWWAARATHDLENRRVVVSAGPTREYLDPVRYLSNPSSGKMGFAVAAAAAARGAEVTLVSGPTELDPPSEVTVIRVTSADEMLAALEGPFNASDLLVMTAAVADWRPQTTATEKRPKLGEQLTLELVRTPDILTSLVENRGQQVMVGFAMETDQGVERAAAKARRKGLAFICLNYPTEEGSAFGGDDNQVTLVLPDGRSEAWPPMAKRVVADRLLDRALPFLKSGS